MKTCITLTFLFATAYGQVISQGPSGTFIVGLQTPGAPTVTNRGTAGSTTYTYSIVAYTPAGAYTVAGSSGSTTTGNATLSRANYNMVTWQPVQGAGSYGVYCTAGCSPTGLVGKTQVNTFFDYRGVGDGTTSPTTETTTAFTAGSVTGGGAAPAGSNGDVQVKNGTALGAGGINDNGTTVAITGRTLSVGGTVTATGFVGNGSGLTGLPGASTASTACPSTSASATAYVCATSPVTAAYSDGLQFTWKADVTSGVAPTLNAGPSAKAIKDATGATPVTGFFVGGSWYSLTYDLASDTLKSDSCVSSGAGSQCSGVLTLSGLTVNGLTNMQGVAATDAATLGAELITSSGWTSTNWTGTYPYTHTTGNTSALSRAITGMGAGTNWQVVITITGRTAGTVAVTIGGATVSAQSPSIVTLLTATTTAGVKATTSANLIITPTSLFDGTVSASVKQVGGIQSGILTTKDSTGAASVSLSAQTATNHNIYFGNGTSPGGQLNTIGTQNVGLGYNSLNANMTGSHNVGVGAHTLEGNTQGWWNTALGLDCLISNTTGQQNVCLGADTMYSNTTGYNNTGLGTDALYTNTTGAMSVAVGYKAATNSNAGQIVAVGANAALQSTSGSDITAIGYFALGTVTTASDDTAVGFGALITATGASNTAVGSQTLYGQTSAANNTALGYRAGYTGSSGVNANTTGHDNVFLGYSSGPASTTQHNFLTTIGSGATGDCDNCVVLGRSTDVTVIGTSVPASASATCVAGTVTWGSGFVYVCVAANTWQRAAIATW